MKLVRASKEEVVGRGERRGPDRGSAGAWAPGLEGLVWTRAGRRSSMSLGEDKGGTLGI